MNLTILILIFCVAYLENIKHYATAGLTSAQGRVETFARMCPQIIAICQLTDYIKNGCCSFLEGSSSCSQLEGTDTIYVIF